MKTLALIFLFVAIAGAETRRYLAHAEKFKGKADDVVFDPKGKEGSEKSLKDFGKTGQDQPSENTQFIVHKSTAMAVIEISFKDDSERALYDKMVADGRLELLSISEPVIVDGAYNMKHTFFKPLPDDINTDWSVKVSS